MRALIKYILLGAVLLLFACKKEKETPTETTASTNNTSPNLSPQEQTLVGYWTLDSVAQYSYSVWQSSYPASTVHMNLQNMKSTIGCLPQDSSCHYGLGWPAGSETGAWSAKQSNLLKISVTSHTPCTSTNTIIALSAGSLVIRTEGTSPGETYLNYYHK